MVRRKGTKMYCKLANAKTLQAWIIMREAMVDQMEKQFDMIKSLK